MMLLRHGLQLGVEQPGNCCGVTEPSITGAIEPQMNSTT